ncbi:hypothetical protein N0V87_001275 [Didymella glomerata]|uniref:Uncharacterized protein n=1 Tax=Didymella glomerata TaxID=749621 RepID=A0A9W9C3J7_9PLEO|nr:hypothetical protein N0V87_001275 [Didymella glomerata]
MGTQAFVTSVPTTSNQRADLIKGLWPKHLGLPPEKAQTWNAYFTYYEDECMKASAGGGKHSTIRTHADVLKVAKDLRSGRTKDDIKKALIALDTQKRQHDVMAQMAEGSIRLAVRLFAMIDVGPVSHNYSASYTSLDWATEQQDFRTLLNLQFKKSSSTPESSKFGRLFNALNIRRTVFPDGFLEETLRTLELLFPQDDKLTRKWLVREKKSLRESRCLDMELLKLDRLKGQDRRFDKFEFWHDELMELRERFEQPGLTSLTQLWYDRRNRAQWITFWFGLVIAVATLLSLFLGIFQTGLGAMQVYKAYRPS